MNWHVIFDGGDDPQAEAERISKSVDAFNVTIDFETCPEHQCLTVTGPDADQVAVSFSTDIRDPDETITAVTCSACGTDAALPQHAADCRAQARPITGGSDGDGSDAPDVRPVRYRVTMRHGMSRFLPTLREAEDLWRAERRDGWPSELTRLTDGALWSAGTWQLPAPPPERSR